MVSRTLRRTLKKLFVIIVVCFVIKLFSTVTTQWNDLVKRGLVPGSATFCPDFHGNASMNEIFFIETSGDSCLTARQACSIESAARTNPHMKIRVYMNKNRIHQNDRSFSSSHVERNCAVTRNLWQYNNVLLEKDDLVDYMRETPLWKLYEKGQFNESLYPLTHLSDAIRTAILWKRGGIYIDLDCLVLRPLHCLQNTVGLVDYIPNWVENGVMSFDKNHPFLHFLMKYMVFTYKPKDYISIGPATLTDAIKHYCQLEQFQPSHQYLCQGDSWLILQDYTAFYAIANNRQALFYESYNNPFPVHWLEKSFLTHVYDAGHRRFVSQDSLYALLAREYCPETYWIAQSTATF